MWIRGVTWRSALPWLLLLIEGYKPVLKFYCFLKCSCTYLYWDPYFSVQLRVTVLCYFISLCRISLSFFCRADLVLTFSQLLFIWECLSFCPTFEGQLCHNKGFLVDFFLLLVLWLYLPIIFWPPKLPKINLLVFFFRIPCMWQFTSVLLLSRFSLCLMCGSLLNSS